MAEWTKDEMDAAVDKITGYGINHFQTVRLQCEVTALRKVLEKVLALTEQSNVQYGVPCDKARELLTKIPK